MILFRKREKREKDSNLLRILIVLSMPYIAMGLSQNGFLGLLPFVREEFVLTRVQVGYYSTSFFVSATDAAVLFWQYCGQAGAKKELTFGNRMHELNIDALWAVSFIQSAFVYGDSCRIRFKHHNTCRN